MNTEEQIKLLESRLSARHQWSQIWEKRALKAEKALAEKLEAVCGQECIEARARLGKTKTQLKMALREAAKEKVAHEITKSTLAIEIARVAELRVLAADRIKINACNHEWYRPAAPIS